ncbi:MAG TPA: tRNA (adenosine(37)-N6)-threonylcarbamoyltransferase complex transferase subunit TsaD [Bacilli bacterium]|jgi:N6-L-threonylcarbamoyladenine synthase|nr:tRNA (adenosine(37)-N6)-threonylcarbamoyltransferase complex transferase subunit TsaD [Bacilli bacterium]HQC83462.1 tRNA (adenosine(37)-N6)-threonylcarbamoyltransferase complex transferase subunit TsaD [Bacilli bacterium]
MNKDVYILGIESSCDETSMSIVKNGYEEIATTVLTQMDTHALYGGVVPEIASRMHTENITMVLEETLKKAHMGIEDVDAIAVTYAPGLLGSLIVGVEFAKTLSLVYNKPLIATHHIAGHIYANMLVKKMEFPLLALVVSGGHTELVLMEGDYQFKVLGTTLDDAIGESYDKVARVLDLPYPGGPNVEKYALQGNPTYELPIPMNNQEMNFSFSGLKSAVINLAHNEKQRGNEIRKYDLAASFQTVAIDEIIRKTKIAIDIHKNDIKEVIVAGGVSANGYLRGKMEELCKKENVELSIPPLKYCTDNATMIACAAYPQYKNKDFADLDLDAKSQEYFFKED